MLVWFLLGSVRGHSSGYCCQTLSTPRLSSLCPTNASCIVADLDGSLTTTDSCLVTDDLKFENSFQRSDLEIFDCLVANWDNKFTFDTEELPFYLETYRAVVSETEQVGLDLRLHYMEFLTARFRMMNLHHCGNPYHHISPQCNPRCVRINKTDRLDNQAFLSYDCEVVGEEEGDTHLLGVCLTSGQGEPQQCGEFWFLVPPVTAVLDKTRPDHQVILLVDKEKYNTQSEVIVYVPTSHVTRHEADMLSIQLLHNSEEPQADSDQFRGGGCWHSKPSARIIHTQNITFNKPPGQNIKVRLTHFLPSGDYQVAMVPYQGMSPLAPPSCTPTLQRLDLGKHALSFILILLVVVIATGWMTTIYSNLKEEDILIGNKEPVNIVVVTDVTSSLAHNDVMEKLFKYLKEYGGVDRIYYARDPEDGPKHSESIRSWWRKALRDPKVVRDGCVLFIPGPTVTEDERNSSEERRYQDLVDTQMGIFCKNYEGEERSNQNSKQNNLYFTLKTAINQKRIIVVKLPYSDMKTLPPQLPLKVRIYSTVSVPLETKQLIRHIQRAEQLTVSINLKKTEISHEKKPWATVITKSVSFLRGGQEETVSLMVPLADQETTGSTEDFTMPTLL